MTGNDPLTVVVSSGKGYILWDPKKSICY